MEVLLNKSSRRPLVLQLLRSILKESHKQIDPIIQDYLKLTAVYAFKKEKNTLEYERIKEFVETQTFLLQSIQRANQNEGESCKFLVDLSYGQVVFSPRHDFFIQAKYTSKLPFGKKKIAVFPVEGYHIVGPAPIPEEFKAHIRNFLIKHPERLAYYEHLNCIPLGDDNQ